LLYETPNGGHLFLSLFYLHSIEIYGDRVGAAQQYADVLARTGLIPARKQRRESRGSAGFGDNPQRRPQRLLGM